MIIKLKTAKSEAEITSVGAELISFKNETGKEYMWQKGKEFWAKCSPFLFPIVGNLKDNKTTIGKKEFKMSKHGFCREAEFALESQAEDSVSFSYQYNDETLKAYPFKFKVTLSYKLNEDNLEIGYSFKNLGDEDMIYTFGAHPAFNVPMNDGESFEDYRLEFTNPETNGCPVYDLEKLEFNMNNRIDLMNGGNKLPLKNCLFDEDAVVFDKPMSSAVKLINADNKGVEVDYTGFDFIAFWTPTKMNAPFLCIEPWCGMAHCSDEDGSFENKRGARVIAPKCENNFKLVISLLK